MQVQKDHSIRELARLKLKLRNNLVFAPQTSQGEPYYVVEDPINSKFHRIGLAEYTFISLLDGRTSVHEALRLTAEASPEYALSEQDAAAICRWLVEANLAHTDESSRAGQLAATAKAERKATLWQRCNPIIIRLPLLRPERFFDRWLPWLGWMHTRPAIILWLAVVTAAIFRIHADWDRFVMASNGILAPGNWLWLLVSWVGLKLVHETSHGVVCKKYGGSVREAGVLLILFAPLAYVDVTSSWRFRSKWQRIQTATAGIYVEFFVAAMAVFVWSATQPGPLNQMCYNVVVMASFTTLVFNANPLMRFDGYYILSDLLEIPNLYASGQQYVSYWTRKYLLGIKSSPPSWSRSHRALITLYGVGALAWRVVICACLAIGASTLFRGAGIVLAGAAIVIWVGSPLVRLVRCLARGQMGELKWRRMLVAGGMVASALVMIAVLPWPGQTSAPAVVEYVPLTIVRTGSAGFVRTLAVDSGQLVESGQVVAVMENDELEFEFAKLKLEIRQSEVNRRLFNEASDIASYQAETKYLDSLHKARVELESQVNNLVVTAPRNGKILARNLGSLRGAFLEEGDELLSIGDEHDKEVLVSVSQQDLDGFKARINGTVEVRLKHMRAFEAHLEKLDPRAKMEAPHSALCASMGGPLAVRERAHAVDATVDSSESFEFLTPRFTAHVKLDPPHSHALTAGRIATVRLRPFHESIGGHLYQTVANWVDHKVRGQAR